MNEETSATIIDAAYELWLENYDILFIVEFLAEQFELQEGEIIDLILTEEGDVKRVIPINIGETIKYLEV